jgi:hypothetical protein
MRYLKPLGAVAASVLIIACFLPWVTLDTRGIVVTGMNPGGTSYGKPGMLHLVFTAGYLALLFIPQVWSRRLNLGFAAFNTAWAFRNFSLISSCFAGECPERQAGIYLIIITTLAMLAVILFAPEKRSRPS